MSKTTIFSVSGKVVITKVNSPLPDGDEFSPEVVEFGQAMRRRMRFNAIARLLDDAQEHIAALRAIADRLAELTEGLQR